MNYYRIEQVEAAFYQLKDWLDRGAILSRSNPTKECLTVMPDGRINSNLTIKFPDQLPRYEQMLLAL